MTYFCLGWQFLAHATSVLWMLGYILWYKFKITYKLQWFWLYIKLNKDVNKENIDWIKYGMEEKCSTNMIYDIDATQK